MQEPILFNWSIKDNIKYGQSDAKDEEVYKAALAANAIEFIEKHNTENLSKDDISKKVAVDLEENLYSFSNSFLSSSLNPDDILKYLSE